MRIDLEGADEVKAALLAMGVQFDAVASDAALETATEISTTVKRAVARGKATGKAYRRGKTAVHIASAPGQPPASDTGRLVGSIYAAETGRLEATAGSPLAYAYYLEFGTRKMAPRPIWLKTAKKAGNTFKKALEAGIRRATA